MSFFWKAVKVGIVALALAALYYSPRASAQVLADLTSTAPQPKDHDKDKEAIKDDGWHFAVTPYIWFSGMHGTVGALGSEASVHADFSDIFNYLNIGAMGVFETRYKRVIMPVDFMWMKLSDEKGLPANEEGVDSIKATLRETLLTPKIGYRIVDGKKFKVDALFGFRYWHVSNDFIAISGGNQVGNGINKSADWVDAVAGGRFELALSPKAFVVVGGDAGGGSARSDWQVAGALGYKISRKWVVLGGYRYLSINYRPNDAAQFIYNVNMPGLALGATYTIK
ncbi:MAG TPA: hypothetical protein VL128_06710 [Candidatus Eisenbacteria bacterium]|nr:hypothetical protein [Candidatus Eisenbacteria bacterium]